MNDSERSDDFLNLLTSLMKKGGPLLPPTIQVLRSLCEHEVNMS